MLGKTIKDYSSDIYKGSKHNKNAKYLFVTEDTLALHLEDFFQDEFDYIIIDEAHHAADNSYTKILNYFKPKFLLGLTATPERSDGKDIFSIFDFNRAVNIRLRDSLEKNLVCPFHYFGIDDVKGIDYEKLHHQPEDGEAYLDEVARMLMKSNRSDYVFEKIRFYAHDGDKTKCLGFCATVDHAKFMADEFSKLKGKEFLTVLDFIGNYQKSFLMTSVFSKEANPDKKTRLREVATDFIDIPGDTFIHFDKIVKERILNQIDKEKFMSDSNQKKAYFVFRKDNGNRMPYLTDYIKHGSELDPCMFSKIKKGKLLYHSYFEFAQSAENDINSTESLTLNRIAQNKTFISFVSLLDTLLPAKRIEEWCIIKGLTSKNALTLSELKDLMKKYVDYENEKQLLHACRLLSGEFWDSNEEENFGTVRFIFDGTTIKLNDSVSEIFADVEAKKWVMDTIEYALLRYDDEFGRIDYGFPFLKPYAKYSMQRSIAPLCLYEKKHSSFRGSGINYFAKTDFFIFVDLYKEDVKKPTQNYNDYFKGPGVFHWEGPDDEKHTWNQEHKVMKEFIHHREHGIHLHLFIRKFKEVEGIPQDYIYLGDCEVFDQTVPKELVSPVPMDMAIHELPPELYNDFITKVDITKV